MKTNNNMETQSVQIKKRTRVSEYAGVSLALDNNGNTWYCASIDSSMLPSFHRSISQAAKAVDIMRIKRGLPPINILKPIGRRAV